MLINKSTILLSLNNGARLKTFKLINKLKNDYLIRGTVLSRSLCKFVDEQNDKVKDDLKSNVKKDKSTTTTKIPLNQSALKDESPNDKQLLFATTPVLKGSLSRRAMLFNFPSNLCTHECVCVCVIDYDLCVMTS